jgi:alcohol dehydrogenase
MADFSIRISPQVILGPDVVNRLSVMAGPQAERCLVVADPVLYDLKTIERLSGILEGNGMKAIVFDEIPEYAGSSTADAIINLAKGSRPQAVIGLGGVRTLSLARAVAMASREDFDLDMIIDGRPPSGPGIPFIAIPTTFRDPFLFSESLVLTDSRDKSVKVVRTQPELTKLVLFDPSLHVSLSPKSSALSCLEIILQSIEGYISQKSSFFSDTLFEKALPQAFQALDGFIARPEDPVNRQKAAEAAFLSAYGLAASSLGVGSALVLSMNARFNIPKSSLSAILLPYLMDSGIKARVEKMATVAQLSGEEVTGLGSTDAAGKAIDGVRQRLGSLRVPTRLKDFDLELDSLVGVAEMARNLEMCSSLPRTLSMEDVYDILKQAF